MGAGLRACLFVCVCVRARRITHTKYHTHSQSHTHTRARALLWRKALSAVKERLCARVRAGGVSWRGRPTSPQLVKWSNGQMVKRSKGAVLWRKALSARAVEVRLCVRAWPAVKWSNGQMVKWSNSVGPAEVRGCARGVAS